MCHSTRDKSFSTSAIPAGNIGKRLDGWPNRDLNVGAIVQLSPNLQAVANALSTSGNTVTVDTVKQVLSAWGPGKFEAELFLDGKGFNPQQMTNGVVTGTNVSAATLIPPAYGLAGFDLTPGSAGARSNTGTRLSRTWRCRESGVSPIRA